MKGKRYTEEQITYALRQAEGGTPVADVCRQLGVSEASFYLWKKKYAGLGLNELRELRQLREENNKLKRLVADLSLDPMSQRVLRGGMVLELTHKEFAILQILLRHAGEVVSRSRLAEQVWKDDLISIDNLIDVHISNLRRKVDAPPCVPLIHTVRGRGFRLALAEDANGGGSVAHD